MISGNLFAAAKQLADSEIQLIKAIENSKANKKGIANAMSMTAKKSAKKSAKAFNVNMSRNLTRR